MKRSDLCGGSGAGGRGDLEALSCSRSPENGRVTWWGKKERLARKKMQREPHLRVFPFFLSGNDWYFRL